MDADLEVAVAQVQEARRAEDLFGFQDVTLPFATHEAHLNKETALLVQRLEPDRGVKALR